MLRAITLLLLLGTAACDSNRAVTLSLQFSQEEAFGCTSTECTDYISTCSKVILFEVIDTGRDRLLHRQCARQEGTDLCSLFDLNLTLPDLPDRLMELRVLVWPEELITEGDCPLAPEFDATGIPLPIDPVPSLGGRGFFRPNSEASVEIPLACSNIPGLDAPTCRLSTVVQTEVKNIDTQLSVSPTTAESLLVTTGQPTGSPVGQIEQGALFELNRQTNAAFPSWQGIISEVFSPHFCIFSIPLATCFGTDFTRNRTMWWVSETVRDSLLTSAGLSSVPSTGMVIGRVVSSDGSPLFEATVSTAGTILYPTEDFLGTTTDHTASHGYFISLDASFISAWSAEKEGQISQTELTGRISETLSTLVLNIP